MKTAPKAGWGQRVGATLIDALLIIAVGLLISIVTLGAGASSDDTTLVIYAVVFLATIVYGPVLMARDGAVNGQTVGKEVLGIRVVHEDGHPMTLSRGLMRDGVGKALLGLVPLYTIIDVLYPLYDSDNQAIHDKIGTTYVVDAKQVPVVTRNELDGFGNSADAPHGSWSAPSQPVAPAPPPPPVPGSGPAPVPPGPAPLPTPREDDGPPPDLGGFAPPAPPPPVPPAPDRDEDDRGPFGPSYG